MQPELIIDKAIVALALMLLFQALKATPLLKSESRQAWIPLMAMGVGFLIYLAWLGASYGLSFYTILAALLEGIIVGASATGLYELGKQANRIR